MKYKISFNISNLLLNYQFSEILKKNYNTLIFYITTQQIRLIQFSDM